MRIPLFCAWWGQMQPSKVHITKLWLRSQSRCKCADNSGAHARQPPNLCPVSTAIAWFDCLLLFHFRQCEAEKLPFADSSVDLVTVMSAFHWFDRPRFLQEALRVLKPHGCLALLNYTIDMELSYPGCCQQTLNQVCKEVHAEYSSSVLHHTDTNNVLTRSSQ